ncbi:MAG: 2-dehydro-3-deoxyglucarate aldolase [Pseudomonadota bacterium]
MTTPQRPPSRNIPNLFRQALLAQQRLIGCWCSLANPISTEVLGVAGFDWILIDAEHAPNELNSLVLQQMALKDSLSAAVVRPAWNDTVEIKRLLDAGFCNFLIPFIESTEAARRAVAATRYPPEGVRGVSVSQRGNRYGSVPDYFRLANQNMAVMLQIESRAGMDAAADIAAIDGVDGLFVGPSDLAAAFGHLGNPGHPEVQQAIAQIFAAARAAGKASGILAPVEADARRYLDMGASFVAVGSDLGVLRMATQALADKFRDPGAAPIAAQY